MTQNNGVPRKSTSNQQSPSRLPKRSRSTTVLQIPIALKFAGFIALLTLAIMSWLSFKAIQVAEENQEIEINNKGLIALGFLASRIESEWHADGMDQLKLDEIVQRTLSDNNDRGIMDLLIYNTDGEVLATGLHASKIEISGNPKRVVYPPAKEAGIEVFEFEYQDSPIRGFTQKIFAIEDEISMPIGKVQVLLSAKRIRQSRDKVRNEMFKLSAITAFAVALGSYVLASFLTRPIRTLVKDLRIVSLGDLDHKSKVQSANELGDLARTFNQMTDNLRQAQEVMIAQKATEHELNLATRIQQRLLPSEVPKVRDFDIAAYYKSAKEVGGDYYDFLRLGQNEISAVIADVSGKGIPGSLVMTMTRSLLRLAAKGSKSPADIVKAVNRSLSPDMNPGMFVTLLYFVVDVSTRKVNMVRAGHNGPILFSAKSNKMLHLNPKGIALGLDHDGALFDSELEVTQFVFQKGDVLVAFTDGVTEAKNSRGEDYSQERLVRVLRNNTNQNAGKIQNYILADIDGHRGKTEQSDDITLMVIKAVK